MAKTGGICVLLVRPGMTAWDAAGRLQGSCDLPMTPESREEFTQRIRDIKPRKLTTVFAAPDEASRESARILAQASKAKVQTIAALQDMPMGLWEGLRLSELEDRFCRAGRQWLEDPSSVTAPEGACVSEFADSVLESLETELARVKSGATVAIVARPIALGVLHCAMNRAELSEMWAMTTSRPSIEAYELTKNDPRLSHGFAARAGSKDAVLSVA